MRISDWSSDVCSSDLELQLAYESGHLNVIGGLYYFDRNFQQNAQTYASTPFFLLTSCNASNAPSPDIAALCPVLNDVVNVFIPLVAGRQPVLADFLVGGLFETLTGVSAATTSHVTTTARSFNVKSYAAYATASSALTDMFTLTAGARYTRDDKDITDRKRDV